MSKKAIGSKKEAVRDVDVSISRVGVRCGVPEVGPGSTDIDLESVYESGLRDGLLYSGFEEQMCGY